MPVMSSVIRSIFLLPIESEKGLSNSAPTIYPSRLNSTGRPMSALAAGGETAWNVVIAV